MTESQTEYFRKPETIAPSIVDTLEVSTVTDHNITTNEYNFMHSKGTLISQDIIKTDDYRKNKATRKEIAHVRFEPD
jgi:hypothetical protein